VESVPKAGLPADRGSNAADILLRVSSDMSPANGRLANVSEEALSFFGSILGHTYVDDPKQSEKKSYDNRHKTNKNKV
jgi:hypothetical protein